MIWFRLVAITALCLTACGDSDDSPFRFDLPPQTFTFSARDPQWHHAPAGALHNDFSCGPSGRLDTCCPPPGLPSLDCRQTPLTCESGLCVLKFRIESRARISLPTEVAAFRNLGGRVLSEVLLDRLHYELEGELSVAIPELSVEIAPVRKSEGVAPDAIPFARLPRIGQGETKGGTVIVDKVGGKAFSDRASDYQTPFELVLAAVLVFRPDTPEGQGVLRIKVSGSGWARP